jgi:hypothetical protein
MKLAQGERPMATRIGKTDKIMALLDTNQIGLKDVLDAIIDHNGIIGVGLITLGDDIASYIHHYQHTQVQPHNMEVVGFDGIRWECTKCGFLSRSSDYNPETGELHDNVSEVDYIYCYPN